jgi:Sec-independent protein translocase protein TatA
LQNIQFLIFILLVVLLFIFFNKIGTFTVSYMAVNLKKKKNLIESIEKEYKRESLEENKNKNKNENDGLTQKKKKKYQDKSLLLEIKE